MLRVFCFIMNWYCIFELSQINFSKIFTSWIMKFSNYTTEAWIASG